MRIAALDLGSNSFHLLVVDAHPDGTFVPIVREKEMLRLGDVVSREGRITQAAAERVVATIRRFHTLAEAAGAHEFVAKATSAIREADNGGALMNLGNGSFVYYFGTMTAVSLLMYAAAFIVDRHIEPLKRVPAPI